jgi:hypothetical protein
MLSLTATLSKVLLLQVVKVEEVGARGLRPLSRSFKQWLSSDSSMDEDINL